MVCGRCSQEKLSHKAKDANQKPEGLHQEGRKVEVKKERQHNEEGTNRVQQRVNWRRAWQLAELQEQVSNYNQHHANKASDVEPAIQKLSPLDSIKNPWCFKSHFQALVSVKASDFIISPLITDLRLTQSQFESRLPSEPSQTDPLQSAAGTRGAGA